MAQSYSKIIKKRSLEQINYQIKFFGKKIWENCIKPLVLAAGTSAGKTLTSLISLEIFYSNKENQNKITLICPASKTVLRDNFTIALEEFNPSFSYYVATTKNELEEAIKDKYQVIIALPQTLNANYKMLPNIHNFILDEAHQWYFKNTIQKIIKFCKPKKQLLLTGTPSKFISKGNDFEFFFVPVMDLYEENRVSNIKIEVVSSSYDFKQTDYLSSYGNLKLDKTNSPSKAKKALQVVCDEMILKLRSKLGNKYLSNVRGANKIASMFNDLEKTIIFCHSVKQANAFYKELSSMKGLQYNVLVSHSENDSDSELFERFRTMNQFKVLIAVDRGRLGYNLPNLFNVVDFTMTQSLDMILQMMGRVLRLSDKKNEKIYYKVATKNTAGYFVDLMTAALCLFKMEWYSKFNGKNMGGIMIPKVLTSKPKIKGKQIQSNQKKKPSQQLRSLEELGIPMDLNLFNQSILYSQGDKFSTIAWTTLADCRIQFFNCGHDSHHKWDEKTIAEEALKYNRKVDFQKENASAYNAAVRLNILNDVCSHMQTMFTYWTEDEIKVEAKKYKSRKEFSKKSPRAYAKALKLNIIDKVCKHMISPYRNWTKEDIHNEAKKYKTRMEFQYGYKQAYRKAIEFGILDEVCSHMKRPMVWNKK
jgi:superfamily II DNA or RNA helicase